MDLFHRGRLQSVGFVGLGFFGNCVICGLGQRLIWVTLGLMFLGIVAGSLLEVCCLGIVT